jgi:hypothetical protein
MSIERCTACGTEVDTDFEKMFGEDDALMCADCYDEFADFDQASEDRYNDPRHGQAAAINRENYKEPRE